MANVKFPRGRRPPANGRGCHRATRLLDVGLDFCCERSVAGEAGGAVAAPWDRTPRVADLSGVEVVRRWCRLPRRSLMARFKTTPNPRTRPAKQLKSNTEECANSIALKRKDNEARPRPGPAPGQGWDYHCGDFE